MPHRPRRLRATPQIRHLVRETRTSPHSLILPFFIQEGKETITPIPSLPGISRYTPDLIARRAGEAAARNIRTFLLFGIPDHKDETGSRAWAPDGPVQQAVREIKHRHPEVTVVTDVCMCEYTSHGHCGAIKNGTVDNDQTLELLADAALSHVRAGADVVAPSDMMDGRVAAIRERLDDEGFEDRAIMSYTVKYASGFYGPFREAAGSAPGFGDRKGYQMDWHNRREAVKEARLDIEEGADLLIVKPAMAYLDVVSDVAAFADRPVAAYSVSGEYAMITAAAERGMIDGYAVMCESAAAVFRAGADILITYFAEELAIAMEKGDIG